MDKLNWKNNITRNKEIKRIVFVAPTKFSVVAVHQS